MIKDSAMVSNFERNSYTKEKLLIKNAEIVLKMKDSSKFSEFVKKTSFEPTTSVTIKAMETICNKPIMLFDANSKAKQPDSDKVIRIPLEKLKDGTVAIKVEDSHHIRLNEPNAIIKAICLQKNMSLSDPKT